MPATPAAGASTMADATRAASDAAGSLVETWRRLNTEQRVAAIGAMLLVISTFGPFSFVEAAIALTGISVLVLLRQRADRRRFHLPFGDGTVILAAGVWAALLIVIRLFDRPLGQSILALGCAAIVAAAGLRERAKRPPDDVPEAPRPPTAPGSEAPTVRIGGSARTEEPTVRLGDRPQPKDEAGGPDGSTGR
jgi:hypothetical protein